jgi:hypothetical protein
MRSRGLLIAMLLLSPASVSARDVATCAALYKQLNNARQVIGNVAEMRRYAQDLAQTNIQIRTLRVEMRRSGCGGGSIVTIGGAPSDICDQMRKDLQSMEEHRDSISAERNNARLVKAPSERDTILASIRTNSCVPSDVEEEQKERLKVQGLELPKQESYSGITDLRVKPPATAAKLTAPTQSYVSGPERPYDPGRKVRMVGPIFLPEENIDLAHPKGGVSQPQQ